MKKRHNWLGWRLALVNGFDVAQRGKALTFSELIPQAASCSDGDDFVKSGWLNGRKKKEHKLWQTVVPKKKSNQKQRRGQHLCKTEWNQLRQQCHHKKRDIIPVIEELRPEGKIGTAPFVYGKWLEQGRDRIGKVKQVRRSKCGPAEWCAWQWWCGLKGTGVDIWKEQ